MIIYQNGLIILQYDPATDILSVDWPDIQQFVMPEIREALTILVESIKNYDIKKLLVDSSKSNLTIPTEEYKEVLKEFGVSLMRSRLEKIARVLTLDPNRERGVEEAKQEVSFTVDLRTFTSKAEALAWLKKGN